jgi:MYXO-CTERM domain-containing protein
MYLMSPTTPAAGGHLPGKWKKLASARKRPAKFKGPATAQLSAPSRRSNSGGSGGSDDSGGSGSEDSSASAGSGEDGGEESYDNWEDSLKDEEAPPEITDEPGASKKGCNIDVSDGHAPFALALLVGLVGLRRRRRA